MARPTKQGLEYFPLDVAIDYDDKFQVLEAKHGPLAFNVIIKLYMKIYSEGYYYAWTEKEQYLHAKRVNADRNYVCAVVSDAVMLGVFDKKIFDKYQILTSRGVQRRYQVAASKRNNSAIDKKYLVSDEETQVSDAETSLNVELSPEETPQSKVKESKVNKSKGKESKIIRYTRIKDIPISDYESEFQLKFPALDILGEFEGACDWELSKGRIHKDALAFFRNWCRKAQKQSSPFFHPFVGGNGNSPPLGKSKQTIAYEKNMALVHEMEQRAANAK